jgi:hypothetical protein
MWDQECPSLREDLEPQGSTPIPNSPAKNLDKHVISNQGMSSEGIFRLHENLIAISMIKYSIVSESSATWSTGTFGELPVVGARK